MINNERDFNSDYLFNKTNEDINYLSPIDINQSQINFFNESNKTERKIDYNDENNKYECSDYSKCNYSLDRNRMKNKINNNIIIEDSNKTMNNLKNYPSWKNTLSELSFRNFRQIIKDRQYEIEKSEYNTMISYNNDINFYIKQPNNKRNISEREYNRERLNKEILNFNFLVKKINKTIDRRKIEQRMRLSTDIGNNNIINYNNKGRDNIDHESIIIDKEDKIQKYKKLKKQEETNKKRNSTVNNNLNHSQERINNNFIKYLKKDNEKLLNINIIYKQIIDTFFYFVNQISKKFSFQNEIKDINHYLSNTKSLSNILVDLEEHLNNLIKTNNSNNIQNNEEINKELLGNSKFIKINAFNCNNKENKKNEKIKTRNHLNLKEYLSQTHIKNNPNNNCLNKTQQYFSTDQNILNLNEGSEKENIKNDELKTTNLTKNNEKLIKVFNKLNIKSFPPKHKNINNKIVVNKNKAMNNNKKMNNHLKFKQSNDLRTLINYNFKKKQK